MMWDFYVLLSKFKMIIIPFLQNNLDDYVISGMLMGFAESASFEEKKINKILGNHDFSGEDKLHVMIFHEKCSLSFQIGIKSDSTLYRSSSIVFSSKPDFLLLIRFFCFSFFKKKCLFFRSSQAELFFLRVNTLF